MTIKKNNVQQNNEEAPPVIVDAVLVEDGGVELSSRPPPQNPNAIIPASPTTPITNTTTNNNTTAIVPNQKQKMPKNVLGRSPTGLKCPKCNRHTITVVNDRIGVGTIIAFFILLFLFWPLCWLPFCIPSCKRTNHYCSHCRHLVGETTVCA